MNSKASLVMVLVGLVLMSSIVHAGYFFNRHPPQNPFPHRRFGKPGNSDDLSRCMSSCSGLCVNTPLNWLSVACKVCQAGCRRLHGNRH